MLGGDLAAPDLAIDLGRADEGAVQLDIDADELNDTDADAERRLGAIPIVTENGPGLDLSVFYRSRAMVSWGEL